MTEKQFYEEWTEAIEEFLEMYHNRPLDACSIDFSQPTPEEVIAQSGSPLPVSEAVVADSVVPDTLKEMVEDA